MRLNKHDLKIAQSAIKALTSGKCLKLEYNGEPPRLVEVHAVGISKAGNPCMRVFQLAGHTHSEVPGWKMMRLDKIFTQPKILPSPSQAPRPGYQKGDRGMEEIMKEF